ncbi:MAG TPA: VOC family protein [Bryobacteraceae bacterium]|nr:VOC family protein [Bryobacteraceae bacterium]
MTRREALTSAASLALVWAVPGGAEDASSGPLPLHTTGLEHIGMTVKDQKASADWYGRIFDPQLFQERDPPPRFYVRMGTAYIAFGGTSETSPAPRIDHFCALVKDYKPDEMRAAIERAGMNMGTGRLGMPTDDDGIRLQLLGVPGGLARTIIPSTRITTDDAAIAAVGLDHVALTVSNMDRAAAYYAKFFGPPATKKADQVWFQIANTRLLLEPVAAGAKPEIARLSFRVAGFDKKTVAAKLQKMSVDATPADGGRALRFSDPNGFTIELTGNQR